MRSRNSIIARRGKQNAALVPSGINRGLGPSSAAAATVGHIDDFRTIGRRVINRGHSGALRHISHTVACAIARSQGHQSSAPHAAGHADSVIAVCRHDAAHVRPMWLHTEHVVILIVAIFTRIAATDVVDEIPAQKIIIKAVSVVVHTVQIVRIARIIRPIVWYTVAVEVFARVHPKRPSQAHIVRVHHSQVRMIPVHTRVNSGANNARITDFDIPHDIATDETLVPLRTPQRVIRNVERSVQQIRFDAFHVYISRQPLQYIQRRILRPKN